MESVFQFNTLYVLESLPDNEIQTGQMLYEDIIKRSSESTGLHHTKLLKLDNRVSFIESLKSIELYAKEGFHPFIHFEIHGDNQKNGLILKSGEIIYWSELINLARQINIVTNNNLVMSLATCYGAYFLKEIKILEAAPFCGCVATTGLLYEDEIITRFTIFFETLFESTNFDLAVNRLNNIDGLKYKFQVISAEELFEDLIEIFINENFNPSHPKYKTWTNQLFKQLKINLVFQSIPKKKLKELVTDQINKKGETFKAELKNSFLMSE